MATEEPGETPVPGEREAGVSLGAAVALSTWFALGIMLVAAPAIWLVMPVTKLPRPFPSHHQDAESLIYLVTFGLALPLGVAASAWLSNRIAAGPNALRLPVVSAWLGVGLGLVVVFDRISRELPWGGGHLVLAGAAILWWVVAIGVLFRMASERPWPSVGRDELHRSWCYPLCVVSLGAVAMCFVKSESISWLVLLGLVVVAVAVLVLSEKVRLPEVTGGLGGLLDVGLVALLVLAVPNLLPWAAWVPASPFDTNVVQWHQNFYLGPANQILAGDALLVDVISQYGVGSIYFLAGAFRVIPIGYGTLGLVEGMLSALMFVGAFVALRMAGVSRWLSGWAMTVAVIAFVYGLQAPIGALLQHGAFRFGLPVGVVVGAVAEARWPRHATAARLFQLLTFAVASVWALEAFAYTLLTLVAVAGFSVALQPSGRRWREAFRWVTQVLGAWILAQLVLTTGTLASSGEPPDWGWYLNTLRQFLFGPLGDWTYDFSSFSPGIALGAVYLASASALLTMGIRRPALLRQQRVMLTAIVGMTAWGVALVSYIVNRGADHIIPYVSLPAVALGALWVAFLRSPEVEVPPPARRAVLGIALGLSAVLLAVAWSPAQVRFPQSVLAHVAPGGPSLKAALQKLADPPAVREAAPMGEKLLNQYLPGERRSIVLTSAELSVEILMRSGRGSAVPFGDPSEDSFVPEQQFKPLGAFVAGLTGGERILLDRPGREAYDLFRADPGRPGLAPITSAALVPSGLASLQTWVLKEIGLRFDLRTIVVDEGSGLEVVELVPRSPVG